MKIQLLFFAYLLFCIGCNQYKNNSERIILNSRSYDYGLMQQNILYFPLDSISAFDTKSLQVFNKGLDKYFVYFNSKKNLLYFYDFYQQKISFNILLAEEGVDGVGSDVNGIFINNLDSIYIFDDYVISRINNKGKVMERIRFDQIPSFDFGFTLEAGTKQNIYKHNDELYVGISSELDPFLQTSFNIENQVLLNIDLKNSHFTTHFDFPEKYKNNIYSPNYSNVYFTFNDEDELFVMSYPADSRLYLESFDNSEVIVDAESKYFNQIEPMKENDMREDFMTYTKHYLTNFSFGPIYFDKYKNIYYRFVEHPISEADFDNRNWSKTCSIVILDNNFNIIGESKFGKEVNKLGIVDELGLLIPIRCPQDNEDFLCIGVYSVVKHNN
jgi:hypothetical protein